MCQFYVNCNLYIIIFAHINWKIINWQITQEERPRIISSQQSNWTDQLVDIFQAPKTYKIPLLLTIDLSWFFILECLQFYDFMKHFNFFASNFNCYTRIFFSYFRSAFFFFSLITKIVVLKSIICKRMFWHEKWITFVS